MTTPGGVSNLPKGALTLATIQSNLEDMSGTAMRNRAADRMPDIMGGSTGGNPLSDFTPFGLLVRIWSEVNSLIANADPADINGPEDLPDLLLQFIEGLPLVGQFIGVLEAILGTYDGDDETLLTIQSIFAPIRALMGMFGSAGGLPVGMLTSNAPNIAKNPNFVSGTFGPGSDGWAINMSLTRTVDVPATGSAEHRADGYRHAMNTGDDPSDRMAVGAGQEIAGTINVSHSGAAVSGLGAAVIWELRRWNGDLELEPIQLDVYSPTNPNVSFPGKAMTGKYVVPAGVTHAIHRAVLTEDALLGLFRFDDYSCTQAADVSMFPNLGGLFQQITSGNGALLDMLASTFRGIPIVGATIGTVADSIKNFNLGNIAGQFGQQTFLGDFQNFLDSFTSGLLGHSVSGASIDDVRNAAGLFKSVPGVDEQVYVIETKSVPRPAFAKYIHAVGVGAGQRGQSAQIPGTCGDGGAPGIINGTTWEENVDFPASLTAVQVTLRSDGACEITIPAGGGFTGRTLVCLAGSGPQTINPIIFGDGWTGRGRAEPFTYNGVPYKAGGNQPSPSGAGVSPGGGGAGGIGLVSPSGGAGGQAAAFLRFTAAAVAGQVPGADSTPPTPPTVFRVVSRSIDEIVVEANGSVDEGPGGSAITGFWGYYFYLQNADLTYTRINSTPVGHLTRVTVPGLTQNTDYRGKIFCAPIDNGGTEGPKVPLNDVLAQTLSATPEQAPMSADLVTEIDAIVAKSIAAGAGPAVGLGIVGTHGKLFKGYGGGNTDWYYRLASQTKMHTGQAVLRFVDAGLLSLDDKLSQFIPDCANADLITIEMLLSMRSGVYDPQTDPNLGLQFTLNPTMAMTEAQMVNTIKTGAPMFVPGESYHYTNANFQLLAAVLEIVDPQKRSADKIIQDEVYTPLGMANTYYQTVTGVPKSPYQRGYDNDPIQTTIGSMLWGLTFGLFGPFIPPKRDVSNQNPAFVGAAGAAIAIMSDQVKFMQAAVRDGTLLSPEMHGLLQTHFYEHDMTAWGLNKDGPTKYGYGLGMQRVGDWIFHGGSWLGYDSGTCVHLPTGTVISVYGNFQNAGYSLIYIFTGVAERLFPGSTTSASVQTKVVRGTAGAMSFAGQPGRVVVTTPGVLRGLPGSLAFTGQSGKVDRPTTLRGTPGSLSFAGQPGQVEVKSAFSGESYGNENKTAAPIPEGATGCWVEAGGGGGAGGDGDSGTVSNSSRYGGDGGAGGGYFPRTFIPRSAFGTATTYDMGWGLGGTNPAGGGNSGEAGGDSFFRCGPVDITAHGGEGGEFLNSPTRTAAVGGGVTVAGITPPTTFTGAAGGTGSDNVPPPTVGANATGGAGAGGGGGGGAIGGGSSTQKSAGANGGTAAAPGGAGGRGGAGTTANNFPGGAGVAGEDGAGGAGGGGGGGGAAGDSLTDGQGAPGGKGSIKVEWV